MKKTILLFGSFDVLHAGHHHLIEKALGHGKKLVIAVAPDSVITSIKDKVPVFSLEKRMSDLTEYVPKATIVAGDTEQGTWSVIKQYSPDIVIVGYDQIGLKSALLKIQDSYGFEVIEIDAFKPEVYKSSLLRKK